MVVEIVDLGVLLPRPAGALDMALRGVELVETYHKGTILGDGDVGLENLSSSF